MVRAKKFKIKYDDEKKFDSQLKALEKYRPNAYSSFINTILPDMRKGKFIKPYKDNLYLQHLVTDPVFEFVYGGIYIVYKVDDNVITFMGVEPESVFTLGAKKDLEIYKDCPIVSAKDRLLVEYYLVKNR